MNAKQLFFIGKININSILINSLIQIYGDLGGTRHIEFISSALIQHVAIECAVLQKQNTSLH